MPKDSQVLEEVFATIGDLAVDYFQRRLKGQRPRLRVSLNWENDAWTAKDPTPESSCVFDSRPEPDDEPRDW